MTYASFFISFVSSFSTTFSVFCATETGFLLLLFYIANFRSYFFADCAPSFLRLPLADTNQQASAREKKNILEETYAEFFSKFLYHLHLLWRLLNLLLLSFIDFRSIKKTKKT